MYCSNCKVALKSASESICPLCGTNQSKARDVSNSKKNVSFLLPTAIVIGVLLLVVIVVLINFRHLFLPPHPLTGVWRESAGNTLQLELNRNGTFMAIRHTDGVELSSGRWRADTGVTDNLPPGATRSGNILVLYVDSTRIPTHTLDYQIVIYQRGGETLSLWGQAFGLNLRGARLGRQ